MREQTYIMIKPDGVQRGLVGEIIGRFEQKGFKLVALKMVQPSRELLETHYQDLKNKSFFPGLIEYMLSGPVTSMVWEGDGVVKTGRKMLGATMPSESLPGTIRGDFCISVGRNVCHGSDSVEAAQAEIKLWFPEGTCFWSSHSEKWLYEKEYKLTALMETPENLEGLKLINRGKVRDIFEIPERDDCLLFVASDRLSCFDVVMKNGVPAKGKILTQISQFWFNEVSDIVPNHVITSDISEMPDSVQRHADILAGRSMLVKKLEMLDVECIVRGYLSGSGWKDYKKTGAVSGIELPIGLENSSQLPEIIFTPSSKAEFGTHDENITLEQAGKLMGKERLAEISKISIAVYKRARDLAAKHGVILADTKFEFGVDRNGELVLADEVLTPDSSRYWPASKYEVGRQQASYDKQYVRDWLESVNYDKATPKQIPENVVSRTTGIYLEIFRILTGTQPAL
eukprot:g1051.t1